MNRFLLEQKITPLVNRYEFFSYESKAKGERVAFIEQKRFKLKEEIVAWQLEDKSSILFTLKAEKVFDAYGRFMVTDQNNELLGYLKKDFKQSLLRSTWEIYSADDTLMFRCIERNVTGAIARRFGGFIPVVGGLAELIPFNFDFTKDGQKIGHMSRVIAVRDTYDIQVEGESIDYRIVLALGVALDALQGR